MQAYSKREWLVIIVLAVFIPLAGTLLFALYRSSQKLTAAGYESFEEDVKTRELILNYTFQERKNDFEELGSSDALSHFYESKALGISMEYGLRTILRNVESEFTHLISQATIKGQPIYKRIVYFDEEWVPLVDVFVDREGVDIDVELLRSAAIGYAARCPFAVLEGSRRPKVYMFEPFVFDGKARGNIFVEISSETLATILNHKPDYNEGYFCGLIDSEGVVVVGDPSTVGKKASLYVPFEKAEAAYSRATFFFDKASREQKIVCSARIFDGTWLLVRAHPASEYRKGSSILGWLILAALLIGTTAGTLVVFMVGVARKNRLQAKIDEERKYRSRMEEAKRAVDEANEKLRQYSLDLEDMVKQRTSQLEEANAELKNTQSHLVQQEKLASIGQLAAGVAHEMNTPVGFVASNFQTLESYMRKIQDLLELHDGLMKKVETSGVTSLQDETTTIRKLKEVTHMDFILDDIHVLFNDSHEGLERVGNIIQNLRDFSRVDQVEDFVEYNINEGIEATLVVARNEIKYVADTRTDLGDVPPVFCNASQVNQVFLNILVNAAQAIGSQERDDRGTITITTYATDDGVVCEITDDGPGIPSDKLSRVFDPFYTTKPIGKGTGLGLSVSYDIIVSKLNGKLLVDSSMGKATKFTIKLPFRNNKSVTMEVKEKQWKAEQFYS